MRWIVYLLITSFAGCAITSQAVVKGQHEGIQYEANVAATRNF